MAGNDVQQCPICGEYHESYMIVYNKVLKKFVCTLCDADNGGAK